MSLGKPIRKEPEPGPEWVICEDRRFEQNKATGKLRTRIKENEAANAVPWWPNMPAKPDPEVTEVDIACYEAFLDPEFNGLYELL